MVRETRLFVESIARERAAVFDNSLYWSSSGLFIFSAEMVVANLDYSSSHVSGILHQFTMLKLLDCTPNEDNTYSYQLNVNPADNPECFEDVA